MAGLTNNYVIVMSGNACLMFVVWKLPGHGGCTKIIFVIPTESNFFAFALALFSLEYRRRVMKSD